MINKEEAMQLIKCFSMAINDLIANGHQLCINLGLCMLKINKN
jgi:hypothetical protein